MWDSGERDLRVIGDEVRNAAVSGAMSGAISGAGMGALCAVLPSAVVLYGAGGLSGAGAVDSFVRAIDAGRQGNTATAVWNAVKGAGFTAGSVGAFRYGNKVRRAGKAGNSSGSKTPSEIAKGWQGSGKYPGIDNYKDITLKKGAVVYRGEPNGTGYFTTKSAIEESGRNATTIFEGLQVERNPIHGYRGNMQGYMVNEDIAAAFGITKANPQFGNGGLPQIFIPDVQYLIDKGILVPVDNIPLIK